MVSFLRMKSKPAILGIVSLVIFASFGQYTLAEENKHAQGKAAKPDDDKKGTVFESWHTLKEAFKEVDKSGKHNNEIDESEFNAFKQKHPCDEFKDVDFKKLKEMSDDDHDNLINIDEAVEFYFTTTPHNLRRLIERFDLDADGKVSEARFKEIKAQTTLLDKEYNDVLKVSDRNGDQALEISDIIRYYYKHQPAHLTRLLSHYDKNHNTYLDKDEFELLQSEHKIFEEDYQTIEAKGDTIRPDGKLDIAEAVKYYFTRKPSHLQRFLNEYDGDKDVSINKDEFAKFNGKYLIFDKDSYDKVLKEADKDGNGHLSIDEIIAHFFIQNETRFTRFLKDHDTGKNGMISKEEYDAMNSKYKILTETYDQLLGSADASRDGNLHIREIIQHKFPSKDGSAENDSEKERKNNEFPSWQSLKKELEELDREGSHNEEFDETDFKRFNTKHPNTVFKNLSFSDLRDMSDDDHDGFITLDEAVEFYFTIDPLHLEGLLERFDSNGDDKIGEERYKLIKTQTNLFSQEYKDVLKFADKDKDGKLELIGLITYYYKYEPAHLRRLLRSFDHDKNGHIEKDEFEKLQKKYQIFDEDYYTVARKADVINKDSKLDIEEAVRYFFTRGPKRLQRFLNEFDGNDDDVIQKKEFSKFNGKYLIFDKTSFDKLVADADKDKNGSLSFDEIVAHYFLQTESRFLRFLKEHDLDNNDTISKSEYEAMNNKYKILDETYEKLLTAADSNGDGHLHIREILQHRFKNVKAAHDPEDDGDDHHKDANDHHEDANDHHKDANGHHEDDNEKSENVKMEFETWKAIKEAVASVDKSGNHNGQIDEQEFENFKKTHPTKVFEGVKFSELKELSDDNHDTLISIDEVAEFYFTKSPIHLHILIKSYDKDKDNRIGKESFEKLKSDTENKLFTKEYEKTAAVSDSNGDHVPEVEDLVRYYYKHEPAHLTRLLDWFDRDNNGFIEKEEFEKMQSKYHVYEEDYKTVATKADVIRDDNKLDIAEGVRYYFTRKPSRLERFLHEYDGNNDSVISKEEFSKFNGKYLIFDKGSYNAVLDAADTDKNGKLSIDEIIAHYYKQSETRLTRFLKDHDTDKNGIISQEEYENMNKRFKILPETYKQLVEAADVNKDGQLHIREIIQHKFPGGGNSAKEEDMVDEAGKGFDTWKQLKDILLQYDKDDKHNNELDESEYEKFKTEHPTKVFSKLHFDHLKEMSDDNHDGLIQIDEAVEYYFTMAPGNLEKLLKNYDDNKDGKVTQDGFKKIKEETTLSDEDYAAIMKVADANQNKALEIEEIIHYYYLHEPAHLTRLFSYYDHDKNGHLEKEEFDLLQSKYHVFDEDYQTVVRKGDIIHPDKKLHIDEAVRYFFTRGPKRLQRFLNEFDVDNNDYIEAKEFSKFNDKYRIFDKTSYEQLVPQADKDGNKKLSFDEIVAHYFLQTEDRFTRFLKEHDTNNNDIICKDEYEAMNKKYKVLDESYDALLAAADANGDDQLHFREILQHKFNKGAKGNNAKGNAGFTSWLTLKEALQNIDSQHNHNGEIEEEEFNKFKQEHPLKEFEKLTFKKLKEMSDDDHDDLVKIDEVVEYYFTINPDHLFSLIKQYEENKKISKTHFEELKTQTNLFDKEYDSVVEAADKNGDHEIEGPDVVMYYYRHQPAHLERLISSFDKNGNGYLDEDEFKEMEAKFNLYDKKDFNEVVQEGDVIKKDGHLDINEAIRYFYTRNGDRLRKFLNEYDGDKNKTIDKKEFDKFNTEFLLFDQTTHEQLVKEADTNQDQKLSIDEIIAHYFKKTENRLKRFLKPFDKDNDGAVTKEDFEKLNNEYKLVPDAATLTGNAEINKDGKMKIEDIVKQIFKK